MKLEIPLMNRRILVGVNYLCVILLLVLFHTGEAYGWNPVIASGAFCALILSLTTFVIAHLKTHLWKMSHAKIENLDEREYMVTHAALRKSYAIFVVISIVILYILTLSEIQGSGTLGVLLPGSLLYIAHSLPSAILAWTEREV